MATDPRRADDLPQRIFTYGWWLVLSASLFVYIWLFGSPVPITDEWFLVPVLSGHDPLTLGWLWTPINEHRVPMGKLVLFVIAEATGASHRAAMFVSAVVLSLVAMAGLMAARWTRGHASYADAFFPLVLLHWGHKANLLWGMQLVLVAGTAVGSLLTFAIMTGRWERRRRSAIVLAVLLVLLPLQGGMGLAATPALALWALWASRRRSVDDPASPSRTILAIAGALALLVCAAYVVGLRQVATLAMEPPAPQQALIASLRTLSMAFGPPPFLRLWRIPAAALVIIGIVSAALLVRVLWKRPSERARAAGLLAGLVAAAAVAVAIGYGRVQFGAQVMATRYAVLSAFFPVVAYCIWVAYGSERLGGLAQMALLSIGLIAVGPNTIDGWRYGWNRRGDFEPLEADIRAGLPVAELARRHPDLFKYAPAAWQGFEMLRQTQRGPYRPGR